MSDLDTRPDRSADDDRTAADTSSSEPRTGGQVAGLGPIQVALALLVLFLVLLVIWFLWPLLGGG